LLTPKPGYRKRKKATEKKKIAQIKELAASISATVEIHFDAQGKSKRGGRKGKVAAKYGNPANPSETWTGPVA
jgi:DNA-binding protein H-NS